MTYSQDPLSTVWQALDACGCEPHGPEHDFRARCPAHDGRSNGSLHVVEGADRRAVVHCFSGCQTEAVLAALGSSWRDLFPDGHRQARRIHLDRPTRLSGNARRIADALAALDARGRPWRVMVATDCAYCGSPGGWLRGGSGGRLHFDCPGGCGLEAFAQALAGRLALAEARR